MEVLQTSALPLGDGAPLTDRGPAEAGHYVLRLYERDGLSGPEGPDNSVRRDEDGESCKSRVQSPKSRVQSPKSKGKLERETGFEPATSTLARSHSTTELFPLCSQLKYH